MITYDIIFTFNRHKKITLSTIEIANLVEYNITWTFEL